MAELKKLLGFMSSWDRQATLDQYEAMFDEGGDPEAVMERLGSPTKVAVDLAKDYVSSRPPGEAVDRDEPEIETFSLEQLLAEEETGVSLAPEPLPEAAPAPEEPEPPETPAAPAAPRLRAGSAPEPPAPEKAGGGAAAALYWVLAVLVGLPVAAALLCVGVPFLAVGAETVFRTVTAVPGALPAFSLLSDALLVAGAGLGLLAVGLLLAWFGLWLSVTLCYLWIFKLVLPLGRRIGGRKGARAA